MPNSVFGDKPLADDNSNQEINVKFEDLVGEGQKYKEADELAKAYGHADATIAKLKAEEARKEAEIKVLKEMLEARKENSGKELKNDDAINPASEIQHQQNSNDSKSGLDEEDLTAKVTALMEEREKEKTFGSNVDSVASKLADNLGGEANAQQYVQKKAKELGVSTEWLMDIAGRSPAAFYNTVGFNASSNNTPAPNSEVNSQALGNRANRRNFAFYEKIRKEDAKTFYKPETQRQMMKDAREMGADFYS